MNTTAGDHPGSRFGAPATGPGAVASLGVRAAAFILDCVLSALLTWAFTAPEPPRNWSLLTWSVLTAVGVAVLGVTPGQLLLGIRVATLQPAGSSPRVGLWAVPRTILIGLLIPPLLQDADGRGLHDRLCRTVVVRSR